MATWSRVKTWVAGDVLTASDLNNEFNNIGAVNTFDWTWSATQTFNNGVFKLKGAGAGVATVNYTNSADNRTVTIPDPGASADFVVTESAQTINGVKSFSDVTVTNNLIIPSATPNATREIAFANDLLSVYNGTSVFKWGTFEKVPGTVYNMKLSLASGTLSIVGLDGNAISATNPAYVVAKGATAGSFDVLEFTSALTFQDDAHASDSDFVGSGTGSWGTTAAVAWGNDMPILLGVCTDGTTPIVVMARLPVLTTGASTNIGYKDVAPSSANQKNVWAWTTTNVTTTHADKPITWIGSVRVQKSASDDWTFQTLDNGDGIGNFYNFGVRELTMPQAQNGGGGTAAVSGSHLAANGGTPAPFTTEVFTYRVDMNGRVWLTIGYTGDAGTDGAGAVGAPFALPFAAQATGSSLSHLVGSAIVINAGVGQNWSSLEIIEATSLSWLFSRRNSAATTTTLWTHADFSNGARTIVGSGNYPASL